MLHPSNKVIFSLKLLLPNPIKYLITIKSVHCKQPHNSQIRPLISYSLIHVDTSVCFSRRALNSQALSVGFFSPFPSLLLQGRVDNVAIFISSHFFMTGMQRTFSFRAPFNARNVILCGTQLGELMDSCTNTEPKLSY